MIHNYLSAFVEYNLIKSEKGEISLISLFLAWLENLFVWLVGFAMERRIRDAARAGRNITKISGLREILNAHPRVLYDQQDLKEMDYVFKNIHTLIMSYIGSSIFSSIYELQVFLESWYPSLENVGIGNLANYPNTATYGTDVIHMITLLDISRAVDETKRRNRGKPITKGQVSASSFRVRS